MPEHPPCEGRKVLEKLREQIELLQKICQELEEERADAGCRGLTPERSQKLLNGYPGLA
jgi:hypothetical protein